MGLKTAMWIIVCLLIASLIYADCSQKRAQCTCRNLLKPVCGTNGRTYTNICSLLCERNVMQRDIGVRHIGACCTAIDCGSIYDPLCDNRGMTHMNICHFRYSSCLARKTEGRTLSIRSFGICQKESDCDLNCSLQPYMPVCTTNQSTFANICTVQKKNCEQKRAGFKPIIILHYGHCQQSASNEGDNSGGRNAVNRDQKLVQRIMEENDVYRERNSETLTNDQSDRLNKTKNQSELIDTVGMGKNVHSEVGISDSNESSRTSDELSRYMTPVVSSPSSLNEFHPLLSDEQHLKDEAVEGFLRTDHYSIGLSMSTGTQPSLTGWQSNHTVPASAGSVSMNLGQEVSNTDYERRLSTTKPSLPAYHDENHFLNALSMGQRYVISTANASILIPHSNEQMDTLQIVRSSNPESSLRNVLNDSSENQMESRVPEEIWHKKEIDETNHTTAAKPTTLNLLNDSVDNESRWDDTTLNLNLSEPTANVRLIDDAVLVLEGMSVAVGVAKFTGDPGKDWKVRKETDEGSYQIEDNCLESDGQMNQNHINNEWNQTGLGDNDSRNSNPTSGNYGCIYRSLQKRKKPILSSSENGTKLEHTSVGNQKNNDEHFLEEMRKSMPRSIPTNERHTAKDWQEKIDENANEFARRSDCPLECPSSYHPVCDSHGVTHPNLCAYEMYNCEARKLNIKNIAVVVGFNECQRENRPIESSEVTQTIHPPKYGNQVTVRTQLLTSHPGRESSSLHSSFECPQPVCDNNADPVCDSEGVIHINQCFFAWKRCLAAREGRTLVLMPESMCSPYSCDQNCSNDYEPRCASDYRTYRNACEFSKAQCHKKELEILFEGECNDCFGEPCEAVSLDSEPDSEFVCDRSGETRTICEFEMLRCTHEKKLGSNITVKHRGHCCPPIELCPNDTNEVCDNRGVRYRNQCVFEVMRCRARRTHGITIQLANRPRSGSSEKVTPTNGKILTEKDCNTTINGCDSKHEPVCGTDSMTYVNRCHLFAKMCQLGRKLSLAYEGECCNLTCGQQWQPICDNFGITHENFCRFEEKRCYKKRTENTELLVVNHGVCYYPDCDEVCPNLYQPVCSVNGETFINECQLRLASCSMKHDNDARFHFAVDYYGECCPKLACTYLFDPVCDSTGLTHVNMCTFQSDSCKISRRTNTSIVVRYKGVCCSQICDQTSVSPVCDGQRTYKNLCQFRRAQCEAERMGILLTIAYYGECCLPLSTNCSSSTPVCDSEGRTHINVCQFRFRQCIAEKMEGRSLHLAYASECCEKYCDDSWDPKCDQYGNLYRNWCRFEVESCERRKRNAPEILLVACLPHQITNVRAHQL